MTRITLLILFLLLMVAPVLSQDATAEPTPEATADAPIVINIEQSPAAPVSDGSLWGYVLVIGSVIIGGVVTLSFVLQGIGNRAAAAAQNPLEMAVIEKGFDSVPSAVLDTIVTPLKQSLERSDAALKQVIDLLQKATDKIPEASKIVTTDALPKESTLTQRLPLPDNPSE